MYSRRQCGSLRCVAWEAQQRARLPRYGLIPAALIGRLARDERVRGEGMGGLLLADAVRRVIVAMLGTKENARRAGARRATYGTEAQCKVEGRFSITFALSTNSAASMRASFGWSASGGSLSKIKHTNGIVSPIAVAQDFGIRIREVELGGTTFSSDIR